jgi:hypothetical protein
VRRQPRCQKDQRVDDEVERHRRVKGLAPWLESRLQDEHDECREEGDLHQPPQ